MVVFVTNKKDAIEAYLQTRNKIMKTSRHYYYNLREKAFENYSDWELIIGTGTPGITRIFYLNKLLMLNTFPLFYFIHKLNYNRNQIDGKKDKFISGLKLFGLGALGTLIALVVLPLMLPVLLVAHPINHLIDKIKKNENNSGEVLHEVLHKELCKAVNIKKFITITLPLVEYFYNLEIGDLDLTFALVSYQLIERITPLIIKKAARSTDFNLVDFLRSDRRKLYYFLDVLRKLKAERLNFLESDVLESVVSGILNPPETKFSVIGGKMDTLRSPEPLIKSKEETITPSDSVIGGKMDASSQEPLKSKEEATTVTPQSGL